MSILLKAPRRRKSAIGCDLNIENIIEEVSVANDEEENQGEKVAKVNVENEL